MEKFKEITGGEHSCPKIRFQGQEYILVGRAITTWERFQCFDDSFAHLFPDGNIKRYGKIIGNKSDIEYIDEGNEKGAA